MGTMTMPEAIRTVLAETGRPMTAHELFGVIIERGLVVSKGKTPYNTLVGYLYRQSQRDDAGIVKVVDMPALRSPRNSVRWALK